MPGWHARTKALQESGRLQLVGIIQEQHAQRCRLFMQWHGMDWPILVDALNVTRSRVVPSHLLLDEHGIVRATRTRGMDLEKDFLDRTYPAPKPRAKPEPPKAGSVAALIKEGDDLFHWGGPKKLDAAIAAWQKALKADPDAGRVMFRLGVAFRRRYETFEDHGADFQNAVASWESALQVDPNQYIWRRRVQQFGPTLAKPYPFYDWVAKAQAEIAARGEKPVQLEVALTGSERAGRARWKPDPAADPKAPDPEGRITRDEGFIRLDVAAVPAVGRATGDWRVHVAMHPGKARPAHWNNEAEPLKVWFEASAGIALSRPLVVVPNPKRATSGEKRRVEVDLRLPRGATAKPFKVRGYALYNVCEDRDGTCLFRRQDFELEIRPRR